MANQLPPAVRDALGGVESAPEAILVHRLRQLNLPAFDTQVQLVEGRKFRWDVVFPEQRVAIEVQGGMRAGVKGGRHNRAAGYEADCVKAAMAQIAGYISLAFTPAQVTSGVAGILIMEALRARGWNPH